MSFDPVTHHRRSIRLQGYDYRQAGAYFITICTLSRECLFGDVIDGRMRLSACGEVVARCWDEIPAHFPNVELDAFVLMPNHVHGILVLTDAGRTDPASACSDPRARHAVPLPVRRAGRERFGRPVARSLPTIVRSFKAATTRDINRLCGGSGGPTWQRNYYERVVRNEDELNRIRQYIADNPLKWGTDPQNPAVGARHAVPVAPAPP